MAIILVSASFKRCSTCEYWTGPRVPRGQTDVELKAFTDKGVCIGRWKGDTFMENHSCSGWRKWAVLE
jgi:hypothetical protein